MEVKEKERRTSQVIDEWAKMSVKSYKKMMDIPNFPYSHFKNFLTDFNNGNARILRFNNRNHTFIPSMIANKEQKKALKWSIRMMWSIPTLTLILAFLYGWFWILPGIFLFFFFMKVVSNSYNQILFQASTESELIFCFLYSINQISLDVPGRGHYFCDSDSLSREKRATQV